MVKIGKYHSNALKISLYFFLVVSAIIVLVNVTLNYLFDVQSSHFTSHLLEHMIFTFFVSGVMYLLVSRDYFVQVQFRQIIREEEKKYQILFENANDAILLIRDHYIIDCNLKSCEIFNCKKRDLIGKSILTFSSESKNAETLLELIKLSSSHPQFFEWHYNRNDDDKASFEAEVTLNQVDVSGFLFIQVFIKDISELKKSQKDVVSKEEKFKMIFNSVTDGIIIFTEDHKILEVNETILNRYQLSREEFLELSNNHQFHNPFIVAVKPYLPELAKQDTISFELDQVSTPYKVLSLEIRIKKILYSGERAYIAVGRDITQRKMYQKTTYNAVIQAEEQERSRIAKELHDGVSPILSTAKLYSQSLRDCTNQEMKFNIIKRIESTIDDSIQSISEISNNLSPHILQNFGLTAAIQSFVDKMKDLKGPRFEVSSNWKGRLEENLEVTLYRLTIELINNSIKHANASTIRIDINKSKDIRLVYSDDGKGFNIKEAIDLKKGMGLFNIVNRVKSLNGTINYFSRTGEGLKVTVDFKL